MTDQALLLVECPGFLIFRCRFVTQNGLLNDWGVNIALILSFLGNGIMIDVSRAERIYLEIICLKNIIKWEKLLELT